MPNYYVVKLIHTNKPTLKTRKSDVKEAAKGVIWNNDFIWSLKQIVVGGQGAYVNTFENRHKLVRDLIKSGDRLFATMWVLGSPAKAIMFKNNLLLSGYCYDTACGICLDEFSSNAVYDHILTCNHKFHYRCLADLHQNKCPMCSADISPEYLEIIRKYVHDERPELIAL
ncbi:MAG: RING finger protein [Candidatus Paceibacterota bacterium]